MNDDHPPLGDFETRCGISLLDVTAERVLAELTIREELTDAAGDLHGGACATLAQAAAIAGTRVGIGACAGGERVRAMANLMSLLAPVSSGVVRATAARRHAGATTWVWEVELTDEGNRLCAMSRLTVAIGDPAR
jgi:uncharacterized protein (TIGR00369 family)